METNFSMHWGVDGDGHEGSLDDCAEHDCEERRFRAIQHLMAHGD